MGVNIIVTFKAKEGMVEGLQNQLISGVKNHTANFDGYIDAKVYRDSENPNHIVILERWESAQNYKDYIGSYSEEDMNAMMRALEGPPEQKILEISLN
ncbi:MAG: hypothetical protein COB15_01225 [Flavobacteriales bacterium]|nr:MAG: hypothetical protein COB15_01225 [Flavobacteriales bacterium]